jgi:hypothetical protein
MEKHTKNDPGSENKTWEREEETSGIRDPLV